MELHKYKNTKSVCAPEMLGGLRGMCGHGEIRVKRLKDYPRPKFTTSVFFGAAKIPPPPKKRCWIVLLIINIFLSP